MMSNVFHQVICNSNQIKQRSSHVKSDLTKMSVFVDPYFQSLGASIFACNPQFYQIIWNVVEIFYSNSCTKYGSCQFLYDWLLILRYVHRRQIQWNLQAERKTIKHRNEKYSSKLTIIYLQLVLLWLSFPSNTTCLFLPRLDPEVINIESCHID